MINPTVTYDNEANAIYVRFSTNRVEETVALSDTVCVDVDSDGNPIGFEILHATSVGLGDIPTLPETADFRDLLKSGAA